MDQIKMKDKEEDKDIDNNRSGNRFYWSRGTKLEWNHSVPLSLKQYLLIRHLTVSPVNLHCDCECKG